MADWPEQLPGRVRARLVAYAAQALGSLATDHVPAPLKRVASFAPHKRARLAGEQILGLLAGDDEFRERIGVQVRAQQRQAADDLAEGLPTPEAGALALLDQADGWEALLERIEEAEHTGRSAAEAESALAEVARLREQLATSERDAVERGRKARADLERVKQENADLRRKLGQVRTSMRTARQEAEAAIADAAAAREALTSATSQAEAEVRRLRSQLEAAEAELARAQRSSRTARDDATIRTRLLLDALLEAGQGLRKELGLPVVEGQPADAVAAELGEEGVRPSSGRRSARPDDPALVLNLITLPRAHLIVDGYNVTQTAWESSTLELQRNRLLAGLPALVAQSGAEITVVFDGYNAEHRPLVRAPRGVRVLFSPRDKIADDVIRELVEREPDGRVIGVVTNDQEVLRDVTRKPGVRAVPSEALIAVLSR